MAAPRPGRAPPPKVPGPQALLAGFFHLAWAGFAMPDFVQQTRDGAQFDIYVCQVCAAMTPEPHAHAAWHRKPKETPSA